MHAAARVMGHSQPGEVLVSRVVTDLVAGTGLGFSGRGSHELKGIPGKWELGAPIYDYGSPSSPSLGGERPHPRSATQ